MLMNYHELTMNEPRDSPARRKQYLVICTVMATFFLHSVFTSGVLMGLDIQGGTFSAKGSFVHKYTIRDYAASMALARSVASDIELDKEDHEDILYNLYLDDPRRMGGLRQRFASGIITSNDSYKKALMGLNHPDKKVLTHEEQSSESVEELIPKLHYETTSFPNNVKAAVLNFPFTNGFVSALVLSYKIIPAMRAYVKKNGDEGTFPVVLTTCSVPQQMCTHYAPLVQTKKFLLGQPDTDTYLESLPKEKVLDFKKIMKGSKKKFGRYFGFGGSSEKKETQDEL